MGSWGPQPPIEEQSLVQKTRFHAQPTYHLKAPHGWINDPCAPGFDPTTGTYHLFYQWNPKSCDWGDICWGHFTSKDGVHWQHNGTDPVLEPSESYDEKGIFTGCLHPTGPYGEKDQVTVIYSSIRHLPIHWTIPYTRDCAGLALATSRDGGITWEKSSLNPILKGEPDDVVVTGFRDPFLAQWPALDELCGTKSLYGIVSGGVVDDGPNAFVYAVSPDDLTKWDYIGKLCDIPVGFQRPSHWTGDLGLNWECVNFMTLSEGNETSDFIIMGTEGGVRKGSQPGDDEPHRVWTTWVGGHLEKTSDGPRLKHDFNGILDNGTLYAANSFQHPTTGERIVWGWIKEEELTLTRRESKGWTGYLSLPREVFLQVRQNIKRTLRTPLEDIPSIKAEKTSSGLYTVQTLGIKPLQSHAVLRGDKPRVWTNVSGLGSIGRLRTSSSTAWELEAVISIPESHNGRIGFYIHHNDNLSQRTAISFSSAKEEMIVDRSRSNNEADINKDTLSGPLTLFISEESGAEVLEKLRLRIFVDGDVLEVFANDRFALSAAVYADANSCAGISWFAEGEQAGNVLFESISLWEQMGNVLQTKQQYRL